MHQFWADKNVFITGANGFIGSWLTRALNGLGAQVTALVRDFNPDNSRLAKNDLKNIHLVHGQLEDYCLLERALNEYEIDTVFHLGAQTLVEAAVRNPMHTFESNIRGTYNLLEACRRHCRMVKRILIASSDKAYGESPVLPYTEEMPLRGRAPYEVSKSCTDLLSLSYSHTYSLPIVIARCGNVYGGGDLNWSRIIPGTIRKLVKNEAPVIRSNGLLTRDYLYVEDAVQAYLLMAKMADQTNVRGEAFNFGPETPSTVSEIVHSLQQIMNLSHLKPIILNQAVGEIRNQVLCSKKARLTLGWSPTYSLSKGLCETVSWYQKHFGIHSCQTV
jgi:CDP-glucose 4,6-dehydratase